MTLYWGRLLVQNVSKRGFHSSKCRPMFHEFPDKDGQQIKSKEEREWEKWSLKRKLLLEFNLFKEGIKETYRNYISEFKRGPMIVVHPHEVDVLMRFTGQPEDKDKWIVTVDQDHEMGYSSANLDITRDSKGMFHGFLDTKIPKDGKMTRSGFVNLRLVPPMSPFKQKIYYNWELYTHIVLRIRGDGRVYSVNLHLETPEDLTMYDTYHYFIWTRGGPYWQHIRIPFSKFFMAYKGRLQTSTTPLKQNSIGSFSLTLADKITGPFCLEIDYVGVEYDPSHIEETAYEQYQSELKIY
ncbi:complex I intermediate-associated protein 30, mitochondrial [Trichogramma pretiosum]|uniref:complex I intermediate-associated protein 30, mitochondrial n=1 Tax=Trichogramma pretiosum TaxID=7493 RepID=UPI000C719F73|nr:complex I intermediate-associated protein 30, mitochondrial [Trichogramma pretiosum]XP_023315867.1 complex I intermediate-associated protein 30, mitochondrial [Trichogramma pretiosum]